MDGLDFIHSLINRFKPPKTKEEIHHEELLKSFGLEYDDDEYFKKHHYPEDFIPGYIIPDENKGK